MPSMAPGPEDAWNAARRWLSQAEADLGSARDSVRSGRFDQACFQSQQAAETALKALLYQAGLKRCRSHKVARLVQKCVLIDGKLAGLTKEAEYLDPFYESARYPDALDSDLSPSEYLARDTAFQANAFQQNAFQVGGEEARRCLSSAESILTAVQSHFTTSADP